MKYCPIISFQKQYHEETPCMNDCAFADEAGDCLVKQALQCYVAGARTAAAEKAETKTFINKFISTSSSGYPYTIEPTSDCIIRSNDFVEFN